MCLLPSRIALADGEALDGFLERLATENGLSPPQLLRLLTAPAELGRPTTAFLSIKPDPALVDRVVRISGVAVESIQRATLMRFDAGLPFYLHGLNVLERHSFRKVVAQGWFPQFGSQVCPECLADDGIWRVDWRLPIVAICERHQTFLTTQCAGCGMRFRTHRHSPLRPHVDPEQPCGNPVGLRNPCSHSVLAHETEPATLPAEDAAAAITRAMAGHTITALGDQIDPQTYLAELRHLASLLLHLLSRRGGPSFKEWASELHHEAPARSAQIRGPRWGFSPPHSARLRGNALGAAHEILSQASLEGAAARLAPWLNLLADEHNGPRGWLLNRTTRTATMERLIDAAITERYHVGRRLDRMTAEATMTGGKELEPSAIPQLIDVEIYREFFAGMLGSYEWTGRLYVSLCVSRAVTRATNWSEAAERIGMDRATGALAARAASQRMRALPGLFAAAIDQATRALPSDRDFRRRESRVRTLARGPGTWSERWCECSSPARRRSSMSYAITWMWCEVAQGCLDASPVWLVPPAREAKAAYRAFRDRLSPAAQQFLRGLALAE